MAEGPNIARFISEVSLTPSPTAESHFHSPLSHLGQVQVPSSSLPLGSLLLFPWRRERTNGLAIAPSLAWPNERG